MNTKPSDCHVYEAAYCLLREALFSYAWTWRLAAVGTAAALVGDARSARTTHALAHKTQLDSH